MEEQKQTRCTCEEPCSKSVGTMENRALVAVLKLNQMLLRDVLTPEMIDPLVPKGVLAVEALQVVRKMTGCDACARTLYTDMGRLALMANNGATNWSGLLGNTDTDILANNPVPFLDNLRMDAIDKMSGEPLHVVVAARLLTIWARLFTMTGNAGPRARDAVPITGMHLVLTDRAIGAGMRMQLEAEAMSSKALGVVVPHVFVHKVACHQPGAPPTHCDPDEEEHTRAFRGATFVSADAAGQNTSARIEQAYAHETRFFGSRPDGDAGNQNVTDAEVAAFTANMLTYGVVHFGEEQHDLADLAGPMRRLIEQHKETLQIDGSQAEQVYFAVNIFAGAALRAYEATYKELTEA